MMVVRSRLDLDEGPVDYDEHARHFGAVDCQTPQRKPIGSLADLVRLPDRHWVTTRVSNADSPGDLVVADAALRAGGRELPHAIYCTDEHYGQREDKELDGAILA
jgi:hypothetical protein